jgi:HSP20 family protein
MDLLLGADGLQPAPASRVFPRANLFDAGEALVLTAEIPGMDESSVHIEARQDVLTISGERRLPPPQGFSAHRQERGEVRFSRSYTFPAKVDFEQTTAEARNGVLYVRLPKAPESKPRSIVVKTSA